MPHTVDFDTLNHTISEGIRATPGDFISGAAKGILTEGSETWLEDWVKEAAQEKDKYKLFSGAVDLVQRIAGPGVKPAANAIAGVLSTILSRIPMDPQMKFLATALVPHAVIGIGKGISGADLRQDVEAGLASEEAKTGAGSTDTDVYKRPVATIYGDHRYFAVSTTEVRDSSGALLGYRVKRDDRDRPQFLSQEVNRRIADHDRNHPVKKRAMKTGKDSSTIVEDKPDNLNCTVWELNDAIAADYQVDTQSLFGYAAPPSGMPIGVPAAAKRKTFAERIGDPKRMSVLRAWRSGRHSDRELRKVLDRHKDAFSHDMDLSDLIHTLGEIVDELAGDFAGDRFTGTLTPEHQRRINTAFDGNPESKMDASTDFMEVMHKIGEFVRNPNDTTRHLANLVKLYVALFIFGLTAFFYGWFAPFATIWGLIPLGLSMVLVAMRYFFPRTFTPTRDPDAPPLGWPWVLMLATVFLVLCYMFSGGWVIPSHWPLSASYGYLWVLLGNIIVFTLVLCWKPIESGLVSADNTLIPGKWVENEWLTSKGRRFSAYMGVFTVLIAASRFFSDELGIPDVQFRFFLAIPATLILVFFMLARGNAMHTWLMKISQNAAWILHKVTTITIVGAAYLVFLFIPHMEGQDWQLVEVKFQQQPMGDGASIAEFVVPLRNGNYYPARDALGASTFQEIILPFDESFIHAALDDRLLRKHIRIVDDGGKLHDVDVWAKAQGFTNETEKIQALTEKFLQRPTPGMVVKKSDGATVPIMELFDRSPNGNLLAELRKELGADWAEAEDFLKEYLAQRTPTGLRAANPYLHSDQMVKRKLAMGLMPLQVPAGSTINLGWRYKVQPRVMDTQGNFTVVQPGNAEPIVFVMKERPWPFSLTSWKEEDVNGVDTSWLSEFKLESKYSAALLLVLLWLLGVGAFMLFAMFMEHRPGRGLIVPLVGLLLLGLGVVGSMKLWDGVNKPATIQVASAVSAPTPAKDGRSLDQFQRAAVDQNTFGNLDQSVPPPSPPVDKQDDKEKEKKPKRSVRRRARVNPICCDNISDRMRKTLSCPDLQTLRRSGFCG